MEEQTGETRQEERKERLVRGNDHSQDEEIKDKEQEKRKGGITEIGNAEGRKEGSETGRRGKTVG